MYIALLSGPAYALAFFLQDLLVHPVEQAVFGNAAAVASLFFLPTGIKFLAFYLAGLRAIPSLIVGVAAMHWFMYAPPGMQLSSVLVGAVASACAIPLVHEILRSCGIDLLRRERLEPPHWLGMLFLVFLASFVSGYWLIHGWTIAGFNIDEVRMLARFATGDTLGIFFVMYVTMWVLRAGRLRKVNRLESSASSGR